MLKRHLEYIVYTATNVQSILSNKHPGKGVLYRGKPLDRVWFLAVPSKTGRLGI